MTFEQYADFVFHMMKKMDDREQLAHCALGLAGEAGEVAELVKKEFAYGKKFNANDMEKELGDVLFYLVAMTLQSGCSLKKVMEGNVAKLQQRYPLGYSDEAAIARVDVKAI